MRKVAICIPSYNNLSSLERLLESIRIKNFKDYYVVITDDSTDNVVQKFVENYKEIDILYYKNEKSLGATKNTNYCIKIAQENNPEYIKIMHHDDYFSFADSLKKMLMLMETHPEADIAFSGTEEVGADFKYSRSITKEQAESLQTDYRYIFLENCIGAPSATIVRNNNIKLDENMIWEVDAEWYFRILMRNNSFIYTTEPLISIGRGDSQITQTCLNNTRLRIEESYYFFSKHTELHEEKFMKHVLKILGYHLSREKLLDYCKKKNLIYIFGAGIIGNACRHFLEGNSREILGYVVSDGMKTRNDIEGKPVFEFGEIKDKNEECGIVLAVKKETRQELIDILNKSKADFFIFKQEGEGIF